ncbi:MAG: hypothetical protein LBJ14_09220, partial [Desulfarculales bacterium]|nr:hypothetical protein [Desulfarculales bacterium]
MRLIIIWVCLLSLFLFSPAPAAQTGLKTYSNSIGMEFVLIPAGKFVMGGGKYAEHNERPGHTVIISKPF